jgi:hypothetical protein
VPTCAADNLCSLSFENRAAEVVAFKAVDETILTPSARGASTAGGVEISQRGAPMSNDEMNRKMEFIVEQQAQFAADIQVLKERQIAFQAEQEHLHRDVRTFHDGVAVSVTVLREMAATAVETATRAAESVTTLAAAQAKTDRQLHRLARLLASHVGDAHGGTQS